MNKYNMADIYIIYLGLIARSKMIFYKFNKGHKFENKQPTDMTMGSLHHFDDC